MKKNHTRLAMRGPHRGMALMVGLTLLLVLTILGIAAIRGTTTGERMSANSQQHATTFQATEAAIRLVMAELRGDLDPPAGVTESMLITALNNGVVPVVAKIPKRTPDSGHGITANAGLAYTGTSANVSGFSTSVEGGGFVAYQFAIDAAGKQARTNASSHHQQGISRLGPAQP
ncbi:MAG: PilX N-terminal domain-containing pilus assembly protein [Rhodanobacteraceae bacterium]